MSAECWWNYIDRGKTEVLGEKSVAFCPALLSKKQTDWELNQGICGEILATERLSSGMTIRTENKSVMSFLSNDPRFPKEHPYEGGSQASPVCPTGKTNV